MRTAASSLIGVWVLGSVAYAAWDVDHQVDEVRMMRGLRGAGTIHYSLVADTLVSLLWTASVGVGVIGVLVGSVGLILAARPAWVTAAYTVVGCTVVAGTWVVDYQRRMSDGGLMLRYATWQVLGTLSYPAAGVLLLAGGWFVLRPVRAVASVPGPTPAYSA